MSLIYKPSYEYESNIGEKTIKFKRWTAKEEKEYLKAVEDNIELDDDKLFNILIKPSIENKRIKLSSAEQKKILIDIRIESINEYLIEEKKCVNCSNIGEIKFKIKDHIRYVNTNFKPITKENITFNLTNDFNPLLKKKLKLKNGLVDYVFNDFLIHVESIIIDSTKHENIKWNELNSFIETLPTSIFDYVFEQYQKQVDKTEIKYKYKCSKCSKTEDIEYTHIPNFLWV